jgi:glycerol dehydrogenase-like iron-containing ADH family enzyme
MIDGKFATLDIVKAAPAQYLVKEGLAKNCGAHVAKFGNRALVSGGTKALASLGEALFQSFERHQVEWQVNRFAGESSESNILQVMNKANDFKASMIIGAGGGKSLDTAKIAASELKIPLITIPTIAATCAAVTPLGIIYNDAGVYQRDYYPARNPDLVLVDTAVILKTPVEYLYSGILDALAKWYEGGASLAEAKNADLFDNIALQLAKTLHDKMFAKAGAAIRSAKDEMLTEALLDVVNLNIYLAGLIQSLGVKAVRNGIAHSVHNGLTVLQESHQMRHGLKVGYGIAVQQALLEKPRNEMDEVLTFFRSIDFRPTFAALNLPFTETAILEVARKTVADPLMNREPFNHITADMVMKAMRRIEAIA